MNLKKFNPFNKRKNKVSDPGQDSDVFYHEPQTHDDADNTAQGGIEHDTGEPENTGHRDEPDDVPVELADIVRNEQVEPGIPQNLTTGSSKNMRKIAFLGVGIVAAGAAVAGLITFANSSEDTTEDTQPTQAETDKAGNTRPKDFNKDKEKLQAEARAQTASGVETIPASAASAPGSTAASAPVMTAASTPGATEIPNTVSDKPVNPAATLRDRRLSGSVFVDDDTEGVASLTGDHAASGQNQEPAETSLSTSESSSDGGLDGSSSDKPAGSSGFADKLKPSATPSVNAEQRGDLTYLLAKGTNIRCGLDTRIITTQPGFTRCIVSKDVYSANGKVLLVERGSKVIGEQTSAMLHGQARVFVLWNELETPSGVKVSLRSPGAAALGESGHGAYVKYHFWQRFGGALLISMISDVGDSLSNRQNSAGGSNNNITYENSSESAQEMATEALQNSINIPPTGTINQGTLINIMVARDVNFDKVYDVVPNPIE